MPKLKTKSEAQPTATSESVQESVKQTAEEVENYAENTKKLTQYRECKAFLEESEQTLAEIEEILKTDCAEEYASQIGS